jgi:para-aminobenzoate synthetase/4-amino-4-deoxychorismate lyase
MTEWRLLETMRLLAPGDVYLLERHLSRLLHSARYFSYNCDIQRLREAILSLQPQQAVPSRLRILLSRSGEYELELGPLPSTNPEQLRVSPLRVDSRNPFLYHKTTNRQMYGGEIGVILVNEHGQITETPITNVAVFRAGHWVTPSFSCGLLPGVMRAELLAQGGVTEGLIPVQDLVHGEPIRCFNALRGVFDVLFNAFD